MKRLMLSVFAAAITAAWAVPAAADVTLSGEYRLRGEYRNNAADYDDNTSDARGFWGQRIRLTANASVNDNASVKLTLQDSRELGESDSLISDTTESPDFHEAYLNVSNVFDTPVSLRLGRQELNYGDQRLVGSFGWSNYGRAFDGFKAVYSNDAVSVDAFYMIVSEDTTVTTNSSTGATTLGANANDTYFRGIYATIKQAIPNNTLDVYLLNQHQNAATVATNRHTIGARLKGAVAGVNYTLELPYQTGETGASDIEAWAFAAKVGYAIPGAPMGLKVGAEYNLGTGDDTATTTEDEGFNNIYPTNHGHFGIGDVVNSWNNINAWSINASADVNEKLNVYLAYWNYKTDQKNTAGESDSGTEIDLVAQYKYASNLSLEAGAARFTPGKVLAPTTPDDAQDWAYLQVTAKF